MMRNNVYIYIIIVYLTQIVITCYIPGHLSFLPKPHGHLIRLPFSAEALDAFQITCRETCGFTFRNGRLHGCDVLGPTEKGITKKSGKLRPDSEKNLLDL